jgi:phosphatidylglycerophosphate synthase
LLVTIAFVFIFLCVFLPPNASNWFLVLFLAVEIGASILYVLMDRRNLKESERLRKELHQINE